MRQATKLAYSLDVIQRAGQPAPLHICEGLAFVYDRNLAWAALLDDTEVTMKPSSFRDGDPLAPLLHQTNRETIEHFAHAAKLLLGGAQAHFGAFQADLVEGLPQGSDKRLATAETVGVVLNELIDPNDRLAEIGVAGHSDGGNSYVWLLVIRQGQVMAAVRMPRSIGIVHLGNIS